MATYDEIVAARDAALACIDSLLHIAAELEQTWRWQWDRIGEPVEHRHRLEPGNPDAALLFIDDRRQHLMTQGHTDIVLNVEEDADHTMVKESYVRGPAPNAAELGAFMGKTRLLAGELRQSAVAADEALTDGVCTTVEVARAEAGMGQVMLVDRSYSSCHLAAMEYAARFAFFWPGGCLLPEVTQCKPIIQRLREVVIDRAAELRKIAAGIHTEAALAIGCNDANLRDQDEGL